MKSRIAGRVVAVAAAVAASCCFITPAFAGNVGKHHGAHILQVGIRQIRQIVKNKMLQMAILKLIMCLVIGRYVRGCLGMQMKMWNPAL